MYIDVHSLVMTSNLSKVKSHTPKNLKLLIHVRKQGLKPFPNFVSATLVKIWYIVDIKYGLCVDK